MRHWPVSARHGGRLARQCAGVLLLAAAIWLGSPHAVPAQVIRDNFDSGTFDKTIWALCNRKENEFAIVKDADAGFFAAKMTIRPYPEMMLFGLVERSRNCIGEKPFDDKSERAEIWEADAVRLRFGADIWYGFTMFIDGSVSPEESRLVIGQWKGPNDDSPMIAQRFQAHVFSITIEQRNNAPGHDKDDTQCRIVVAHDAKFPLAQQGDRPDFFALFEKENKGGPIGLFVGSLGHDRAETVHTPLPCRTDIAIEPHNDLPDPFGRWTRMIYHFRVAGDANGYLDIWADDVPIVTVRGRIGFPGSSNDIQYFKFGPYRDRAHLNGIYAMLARYARGPRKEDVQ